ncbi:MAG: hypothetical protein UZ14_CFX002002167 [Chloroflexi bacterium OLB14]|nr:MAG: hypothetical protein UZ14_CFX002002167 [Chloroflexi bacterium OLB14]
MKLKNILLIITGIIVLVSCTSAPTQALNITVTSEVTITSAPTNIPSPTETQVPTIDPNAPAEYSRFENGDYFLDKTTENGNTLTYIWDEERNSWYLTIFSDYMLDRSREVNDEGYLDAFLMNIYIDSSIEAGESIPTLHHTENIDPRGVVNFNTSMFTNMINACLDRDIITTIEEFNKPNFDARKFYLDFSTVGGSQRWGLWPGTIIEIHIRGDYQSLIDNKEKNGFSEIKSPPNYGYTNSYMIKIWTDMANNLYVDIAPSLAATKWTEAMFYEMAFVGPGLIFEFSDLTNPEWTGSKTSEFVLGRETWPYFVFGSPQ